MRRGERGAVLVLFVLFLIPILAFLALGLDYGGALVAKQQGLGASESAGRAALAELWAPDYLPLDVYEDDGSAIPGDGVPDWPRLVRSLQARQAAADLATLHDFGPRLEVVREDEDDLIVHVRPGAPDPERGHAYVPDIQLNLENDPEGDILFGAWVAGLPSTIEVVLRRSPDARIEGVREGDNPLGFTFGRTLPLYEEGPGVGNPARWRNRGIGLRVAATVSLAPAAEIPPGIVVAFRPRDADGDPETLEEERFGRAGVLPVAIDLSAVSSWFSTPAAGPLDLTLGEAWFFVDLGAPLSELLAFLAGSQEVPQTGEAAPRAVRRGEALSVATEDSFAPLAFLSGRFRRCLWTVPVVNNSAERVVVGFLRVFAVDVAASTLRLAPAPSGYPRFALGVVPAGSFGWDALDPRRPASYGVVCVPLTVRYTDVEGR